MDAIKLAGAASSVLSATNDDTDEAAVQRGVESLKTYMLDMGDLADGPLTPEEDALIEDAVRKILAGRAQAAE